MRDINSLNKVILIGRLGQKPEMRRIPQQERWVANFTLATNERLFNPSTRESTDRTEWHKIVVFGKLAEFCEKYLSQGKQVLVEGKLRTREWQDRDGNKRKTTEIVANNIVLLGRREEYAAAAEGGDYEPRGPSQAEADIDTQPFDEPTGGSGGEDDIPF
jgi:single-strand DNA-binding protein